MGTDVVFDPSEPDPETGAPRGLFVGNELAGYGGTSHADPETCAQGDCLFHRLWFYDVSAGPMGRTGRDTEIFVASSPSAPQAASSSSNPQKLQNSTAVGRYWLANRVRCPRTLRSVRRASNAQSAVIVSFAGEAVSILRPVVY